MRIRDRGLRLGIFRSPLFGAAGACRQLPLVLEQVLQEPVIPLDRIIGPRALQPAGDRVRAIAVAVLVFPAESLLLNRGAFGLWTDVLNRRRGAMRLAEGVAAGDERNGLLVVHRHAAEGLAD